MAKFEGEGNAPAFHYEDVDISLIKPRKRDYSSKHDVAAKGEERGINNMSRNNPPHHYETRRARCASV